MPFWGFRSTLVIGAALAVLAGCTPEAVPNAAGSGSWPPAEPVPVGWKRIRVGDAFSFEVPADTKLVSTQGIDSTVGWYSNSRFNLTFDYGAYANSLGDETPWTTIHGYKARLELGTGECQLVPEDTDKWPYVGYVHVQLRPMPDFWGLTMSGCAATETGLEELRRTYESLRFNAKAVRSDAR